MSRGLGKRERGLLRSVDRHPGKWVRVTGAVSDPSVAVAMRRAAHSLAKRGEVELRRRTVAGRSYLVIRRPVRILPDDLELLLPENTKKTLIDEHPKALAEGRWEALLDVHRQILKNYLYDICLATSRQTSMNIAEICNFLTERLHVTSSSRAGDGFV